jgi:Na+/phosphate symporter
MNGYAVLLIFVAAIVFLYSKLSWLGLIFILIGIILIAYNSLKKNSKTIWKEFSEAKTKDNTPALKKYVENASKLAAEAVTRETGTQYQITSPQQFQKGSKSFFDELKKIFK